MKQVKLGDITTYNKGFAFNSKEYTDEGIMVVRVSDFTQESISKDNAVYILEKDKYAPFKLNTDDILIQTVGSWANNPNSIVGKVVKVPKDCAGMYLNQNIVRIIPKERFNNRYLYYALKANKFPYYCVMRGQGAANQASITLDTIFRFKFNAHDEETQNKIASILSTYDDLIEKNNRKIEILQEMAEELYKEWFVRFRFPGYKTAKFIDGIPEGWKITKIGDRFKTVLGGTPSREKNEYWDGGTIPWINSGAINLDRIINATEYITEAAYKHSATELLPKRSTLVAITGATLGQISLNEIEVCTNQSVVGIIDEKNQYQLYLFLHLKKCITHLCNYASGGAQQHINKDIINKYKIVIPNQNLIQKFNCIALPIFDEVRDLLVLNTNLTTQRDLLLPRLMSGKLEVKVS